MTGETHATAAMKQTGNVWIGEAEFKQRGICRIKIECQGDDAMLRVFMLASRWDKEAPMIRVKTELDEPNYWHSYVSVEGYDYMVRMTDSGVLSFIDAPQPYVGAFMTLDDDGRPVLDASDLIKRGKKKS